MEAQWMDLGESRVCIRREFAREELAGEALKQVSQICAGELNRKKGRPALSSRSGPPALPY